MMVYCSNIFVQSFIIDIENLSYLYIYSTTDPQAQYTCF